MPPTPPPVREPDHPGTDIDHPAPPRAVRALRCALFAEAALCAAAGVGVVVDLVARGGAGGQEIGMAAFLVLCALGVAWALVAAARALGSGRRVGRAVAMTWQIFQVIIGISAVGAESWLSVVAGVVLIALAVAVAVLLLMPRVVEATTRS
ncbi:MAG: hypothetical protein FWF90_04240 [Promicromonosporaceae bacterium]|nr:hypothetical protein [Promicromonosporaceae bacterium]